MVSHVRLRLARTTPCSSSASSRTQPVPVLLKTTAASKSERLLDLLLDENANSCETSCKYSQLHMSVKRERKDHTTSRLQQHQQPHQEGWRFATESPWTQWHTGGSRQGHPRYTSARQGRPWVAHNEFHETTPDELPPDKDKPSVKRVFTNRCSQTLVIIHFGRPLVLRSFAETSGHTKFRRRGFDAWGIKNKFVVQVTHILNLALAADHNQAGFVETLGSPFVALCASCRALRHGKRTKRSRPGIAGPDPLRVMSVTPVGSLASKDQIMIGCRLPVACSIFPSCGHVAAQMQCGMVNRKPWPESAVVVSRYVFTVGGW